MERIGFCIRCCDYKEAKALVAATEAALAAGAEIRRLFGHPHQIRMKGEIDLVTEADLASEKIIIEILARRFAGPVILAEESFDEGGGKPLGDSLWIIDPLDGTTNFAHGFPHFCVSIAWFFEGRSRVGVIYDPVADELFCAALDAGSWLNGSRIQVTNARALVQSLVATGFPYEIRRFGDTVLAQLGRVLPEVRDIRRAGAAALDLAYVACGRLDGFWEMNLKPWDTAAGQILLIEAGGQLSSFGGGIWDPFLPEVVATNGLIHNDLVALLAGPG
ncbi:MAG: inositol monophosphatase [Proteobacteria bacterium]|nr:inositol monophosphatase [Pseudomonadota bacterium]MBU1688423.1 inositol monophosphatase [Pseudomonadota bacterium]